MVLRSLLDLIESLLVYSLTVFVNHTVARRRRFARFTWHSFLDRFGKDGTELNFSTKDGTGSFKIFCLPSGGVYYQFSSGGRTGTRRTGLGLDLK